MNRFKNFQQAIVAIDNFDSLCDYFEKHIGAYGFYAFTLGFAPLSKGKVDSSGAVLFTTLPAAMVDDYHKQEMAAFDPVFEWMANRSLPFTKSSVVQLLESTPQEKKILDMAEGHDLGDALMIPVSTAGASRGVVLFSKEPAEAFEKRVAEDGPLLHLMAIHITARAEELGFGLTPRPELELTGRETECLQLSAQGKTYEEIASALGITERTARFHIRNACKKLGTSRRSRAIVLAIQQGLIRV